MSFIRNIFDVVINNLISGDAYYIIAKSVIVTLAIAVVAWLIAFLVGGFLSYFMSYDKKLVSRIAEVFCFVFRSTPVLLIMLLFYYVFLKSTQISPIIIASLSLGLYGAGHFAEILARCVLEAQKRQDIEVTKRLKNVYYSVAAPQAMEESIFQIKRLTIQMFQWITVVGYITVNDLTAVMNRIGQRTMYPFFSIFVCIIFYMVITIIIESIFNGIEKRLKSSIALDTERVKPENIGVKYTDFKDVESEQIEFKDIESKADESEQFESEEVDSDVVDIEDDEPEDDEPEDDESEDDESEDDDLDNVKNQSFKSNAYQEEENTNPDEILDKERNED